MSSPTAGHPAQRPARNSRTASTGPQAPGKRLRFVRAADINDSRAGAIAESALVDAVGPSWSTTKVRAELGGVSSQAVHQRVDRGTLWALPTSDGSTVFPTFQFVRRHGRLETKRGLQAMFKVLQGEDPWAVAVLMRTPAPELENTSPVEWERSGGDFEALERLAHDLVREWNHP